MDSQDQKKAIHESLRHAIDERRKTEPLIGAVLGGKEVAHNLWEAMLKTSKDARGVHAESYLCMLGSLAGYACQAGIRARNRLDGQREDLGLVVATTKDGGRFFFGDRLNAPLAESQHSVWGLAAGEAQSLGVTAMPDLKEIFEHVSHSLGTAQFGVPRLPPGSELGEPPVNTLVIWPNLLPTLEFYCAKPEEWPILMGIAVQHGLRTTKEVLKPELGLKLVMECAIPMSKVELAAPAPAAAAAHPAAPVPAPASQKLTTVVFPYSVPASHLLRVSAALAIAGAVLLLGALEPPAWMPLGLKPALRMLGWIVATGLGGVALFLPFVAAFLRRGTVLVGFDDKGIIMPETSLRAPLRHFAYRSVRSASSNPFSSLRNVRLRHDGGGAKVFERGFERAGDYRKFLQEFARRMEKTGTKPRYSPLPPAAW